MIFNRTIYHNHVFTFLFCSFTLILSSSSFSFSWKFRNSRIHNTKNVYSSLPSLTTSPSLSSSSLLSSYSQDFMIPNGLWYEMNGCHVLFPTYEKVPKAIIHFIGGFLLGIAPSITYGTMLMQLAEEGYLIIATPYSPMEINHNEITSDIIQKFRSCYYQSLPSYFYGVIDAIPVIGLSHSLGGKLSVLMNSRKQDRKRLPLRTMNIFISFNNYGMKDSNRLNKMTMSPEVQNILDRLLSDDFSESIKSSTMSAVNNLLTNAITKSGLNNVLNESTLGSQVSRMAEETSNLVGNALKNVRMKTVDSMSGLREKLEQFLSDNNNYGDINDDNNNLNSSTDEFIPSPEETYQEIMDGYNVQDNLLIKFKDDSIDQTNDLKIYLLKRGCDCKLIRLHGNHLTPNTIIREDINDSSFQEFMDTLIYTLNFVSNKDWASKNFTHGDENDDFYEKVISKKYRSKYQLPSTKTGFYLDSWDDDNIKAVINQSTDIINYPSILTENVIKSFDIRCILSDVDGTLLPKSHVFSDKTLSSISNVMKEKGYPFFPCTGRTRGSMVKALGQDFVHLFGESIETIPGVYQQGLTVYGRGGKLIYEQVLEQNLIEEIVDFCDENKIPILGYAGEKVFCRQRCKQTDKIVDYSDPMPIEVPDGLPTLRSKGIAIQKMIMVEDDSVLDQIRPKIYERLKDTITITKAVSGMLELLPYGASKGKGVAVLLHHFQIDPNYVIAFGDGENDIEMIEYVKYGIAMENSNNLLKQKSLYIIGHVNDDSVAKVLDLLPSRR